MMGWYRQDNFVFGHRVKAQAASLKSGSHESKIAPALGHLFDYLPRVGGKHDRANRRVDRRKVGNKPGDEKFGRRRAGRDADFALENLCPTELLPQLLVFRKRSLRE